MLLTAAAFPMVSMGSSLPACPTVLIASSCNAVLSEGEKKRSEFEVSAESVDYVGHLLPKL